MSARKVLFCQNNLAAIIFILISYRDSMSAAEIRAGLPWLRLLQLFRESFCLSMEIWPLAEECIGFDLIGTTPALALLFFMHPALNSTWLE
jgi:hypothetical protein